MPTYEYACQSCGTHIEVYQSYSDQPLTECGVCGGRLRKVFHPAGILFKGSGFYVTDSRSAKERAPATSGDGGKKSEGGKADGKAGEGSAAASGGDSKTESTKAASSGSKEKSA